MPTQNLTDTMTSTLELLPSLFGGLWVTVQLFLGGSAVACACAFSAGLSRLSLDPVVRATAAVYVEIFRGTSILVQLFWFYFALPMLMGVRLDAMLVGILVLGLNLGAYGAEVVRAAVVAVPQAQHLAAVALNLTRWQRFRYVIVPQAVPAMLPPFGNLLIELLKSTALVSMITVTDLTRAAVFLRDETLRTGEIFGLLLAVYFLLSLLITTGVRLFERRVAPK